MMEKREIRENLVPQAALGWQDARAIWGSQGCRASRGPLGRRA